MGIDTHALDEFIKTDREVFRAQATSALHRFDQEQRELAASVETEHVVADDLLRAWDTQIEPIYQDLDETRHDPKLKKYLINAIGFTDNQAESVIEYMIKERKQALLDEVLGNLYHSDGNNATYQREYAEELLTRSPADINDYMSRYIDFIQAVEASEKYNILLCDPHGSWLERQKAALAIHKERQKTEHEENRRIDEISTQLSSLENNEQSLLGQIVTKQWDFITILDLRNKYQKRVDDLTPAEKKNPTKRLKLFERVTASFRDREAERLSHIQAAHTLKQLREINEEVYNLLLEVFDLPNNQRNLLLIDIQKHTRLTQERDLILLIQRNREHFMTNNT